MRKTIYGITDYLFAFGFCSLIGVRPAVHIWAIPDLLTHSFGGDVSEVLSKIDSQIDMGVGAGYALRAATSSAAWYAIQTLCRYEQRISRELTAKGFPTYLPLLRETRQWTDRKKVIESPVFGGYIFVRHDASPRSRVRVLETSGVVRMLGDNHAPVPVADFEIESLRRTLESNVACQRCEYPALGALVKIQTGPLAGISGRLVRIHNRLRLVLSVSTVRQAISVEVDLKDVQPAAQRPDAQVPPVNLRK